MSNKAKSLLATCGTHPMQDLPEHIQKHFINIDAGIRALAAHHRVGQAKTWRFCLDALQIYAPNGIDPPPDLDISDFDDAEFFEA